MFEQAFRNIDDLKEISARAAETAAVLANIERSLSLSKGELL